MLDKGQREGHVSTVGHTLTATQNENDCVTAMRIYLVVVVMSSRSYKSVL